MSKTVAIAAGAFVLLALAVAVLLRFRPTKPARFEFQVHDVFYIKSPIDRVILTGRMERGRVHKGDAAVVQTRTGPVRVMVEGIEVLGWRPGDPETITATAGDQIGLRLTGISRDQPSPGDRVIGAD